MRKAIQGKWVRARRISPNEVNSPKCELIGRLYVGSKEYFLPYEHFPWFKQAKISEIYNVKLLHGHHLRWEQLDVDLELESLKHPEKYPLRYE